MPGTQGHLVATAAAALLFLLTAGVLFYEAVGVAGLRYTIDANTFGVYQTITSYVRCAVSYDFDPLSLHLPIVTTLVVAVYFLLLGHWLCYPAVNGARVHRVRRS